MRLKTAQNITMTEKKKQQDLPKVLIFSTCAYAQYEKK